MKQTVVSIRAASKPKPKKIVPANEKAVEALPLDSGTWRIRGVPGMYVRSRAASKVYYVQRRIRGRLIKRTIGTMPLKRARVAAMREWGKLRPVPVGGRRTLQQAFDEYLAQKALSSRTKETYSFAFSRYLREYHGRSLDDIGADRAGVRALYHDLADRYGKASAALSVKLLGAVYRYQRKTDANLPECPTTAVSMPALKSRDWALSPDELKTWWEGVQTLTPIRRAWWITTLLTGARKGSVEALQWSDLDLNKKTIRFCVTKGDRPYMVPMSDKLAVLLTEYRASGKVPPSDWVFPAPGNGGHLVDVSDAKRGVKSPHHLRHTFRTILAELGASSDQARLLMGHSMGGDISRGYITPSLLVESLRPVTNAVSERLAAILGDMS